MDDARAKAKALARGYLQSGRPTDWFEALYSKASGDPTTIPWADLTPNPNLMAWARERRLNGEGNSALVVGCGLGDDAEALAGLGFQVMAFDLSPTAIAWARERFPGSRVQYCTADLFAAPKGWKAGFDFVFEAYTLQVLPATMRAAAIDRIAEFVAPGGRLLVVCRGRDDHQPLDTDFPWPLARRDLSRFDERGLGELSFEDYMDQENPPVRRFRVVYRREK